MRLAVLIHIIRIPVLPTVTDKKKSFVNSWNNIAATISKNKTSLST